MAEMDDVFRRGLMPLEPTVVIDGAVLTDKQVAFLRSCVTVAIAREPNACLDSAVVDLQARLLEASPEARRAAGLL